MDSSTGKVFSSGFNGTATYKSCITDVLSNAFQQHDSLERPVTELEKAYDFRGVEEIKACQFATTLAQYVAIYWDDNTSLDKNYGSPGAYDGEAIETMEDLFLLSVFEMYTRLVLKNDTGLSHGYGEIHNHGFSKQKACIAVAIDAHKNPAAKVCGHRKPPRSA